MTPEMKTCKNCFQNFSIFPEDDAFYEKMNVPSPTWCPQCREMRRFASGNDLTLYRSLCDLCRKEMISTYCPGGPFTIYCTPCWWSDGWDPLQYGMEYDSSKSFFEQFKELQRRVPRMATATFSCESSPYVNNCGGMKNCYMCASCGYCEDSYYLVFCQYNKDCSDLFRAVNNELCYELVNTNGSYHSAWLYQCEGMIDSFFCYDCKNCTKCIFSSNLRNKTLHIFNKPVSEQEYMDFVATLRGTRAVTEYKKTWHEVMRKAPHKYLMLQDCQNVIGDNVSNSANSYALFDSENCENVRYARGMFINTKDTMDVTLHGDTCELGYEGYGLGTHTRFCVCTRQCFGGCDALFYSDLCTTSHDLFGCICLRSQEYCILNRRYSKEEYEQLKERIIRQMTVAGEYGEYFPGALSPFGYNESAAMIYYPLSKEEALSRGYPWNDAMPETKGKETIQWREIPDSIEGIDESIAGKILACEKCGKNYKIIKQELRLLKKMGLPLPHHCSLCRHAERFALRNPAQFWRRQCQCAGEKSQNGAYENTVAHHHGASPCATAFETTYAPDRPEIVYCEQCYQKEVV